MAKPKGKNKISRKQAEEFRGQVLDWYDKHRRDLPWRAKKGQVSEPYHVWLSEIMLQQTTVGAVQPYFIKFLEKWPTVQALAEAEQEEVMKEWAGLGYYARARNLHKCAKVVANDLGGVFPEGQKELQTLPGIGDYTSAAIRTIAFNKPATVVDGNIERVMARYFAVQEPLPKSKPTLKELAHQFFDQYEDRPGDFAQGLMDLGAGICIAKTPRCSLCPLSETCKGHKKGIAETLPKKEKKKPRPKRYGTVYWVENAEGQLLLHRRPEKGLLGGMVAFPTTDWADKFSDNDLHFVTDTQDLEFNVHHTFTHFDLELRLKRGKFQQNKKLSDGYFWLESLKENSLGMPTVFNKALKGFLAQD